MFRHPHTFDLYPWPCSLPLCPLMSSPMAALWLFVHSLTLVTVALSSFKASSRHALHNPRWLWTSVRPSLLILNTGATTCPVDCNTMTHLAVPVKSLYFKVASMSQFRHNLTINQKQTLDTCLHLFIPWAMSSHTSNSSLFICCILRKFLFPL